MDLPVINVRWSSVIPCAGADASPIPARGGVYELLYREHGGVERMFVGQTEDLRRTFVSHMAGSKGSPELRRAVFERDVHFRYWECEVYGRRLEVVCALRDLHYYDCGTEDIDDGNVACVRLVETA